MCWHICITFIVGGVMLFATNARGGQISGTVVYKGGTPAAGISVVGSVSGGGVTKSVTTDRKGYFVLRWSSDAGLDKLIVNGVTKMRDVSNGADVAITLD